MAPTPSVEEEPIARISSFPPVATRGASAASFWFGETQPAYKLPIPDIGPRYEVVLYEANRIDDQVTFTLEASKKLTGIPRPFLRQVLEGIVRQAKARKVAVVDPEFLALLNQGQGRG